LEADDCAMISETLQGVERQVIEWYFGKGVEPLAYIEVQPPVREDKSFLIEAMEFLSDKGVRIAKGDALERLGFAEADEADEVLGVAAVVTPDPLKVPAANAKAYKDFTDFIEAARGKEEANAMRGATAVRKLRTALAADMQPLGDALFAAYSAGDEPAMRAALKKISADMPELAKADGLAAELSRLMTAAYTHESDDA
jgi:phage gp29-like protein